MVMSLIILLSLYSCKIHALTQPLHHTLTLVLWNVWQHVIPGGGAGDSLGCPCGVSGQVLVHGTEDTLQRPFHRWQVFY